MKCKFEFKNIKRGDIIETHFGLLLVINADFKQKILEGYEIKSRKINKKRVAYNIKHYGEGIKLYDKFI